MFVFIYFVFNHTLKVLASMCLNSNDVFHIQLGDNMNGWLSRQELV